MRRPEVDEDPGPATPAVYDHSVIEGRVLNVSGRQLLRPCQVPRDGAHQHHHATASPGPSVVPVLAHLSSRREARGGAAQRRGAATVSSSSSPTMRASPSTAGRCRGTGQGQGPAERHDGQETPILRAEATVQQRAQVSPGPQARPRSPGHVRPPPPARASPRCRYPPPAPAATSPDTPATANRGPRRRAPPGGAPPLAISKPNRHRRPPAEARPRHQVTNWIWAERRPQRAKCRICLRPCSHVRPSPGVVIPSLPPARPMAGSLPPAASQWETPK